MDDDTVFANSDAILPGRLRVGNEAAARALPTDNYDRVVSVAHGLEVPATTHSAAPHVDERAREQSADLANAARTVAEGLAWDDSTFVHCYEGKERAPTVAAAALAHHRGITSDSALEVVAERRPITEPTPHLRAVGERVVTELLADE